MQHWLVTITVGGHRVEPRMVEAALERLTSERPFLQSCRFGPDTAEICFWDQGETMLDVASLALRLWDEHRSTASLPEWQVIGLEVVAKEVYDARRDGQVLVPVRTPPAG